MRAVAVNEQAAGRGLPALPRACGTELSSRLARTEQGMNYMYNPPNRVFRLEATGL